MSYGFEGFNIAVERAWVMYPGVAWLLLLRAQYHVFRHQ